VRRWRRSIELSPRQFSLRNAYRRVDVKESAFELLGRTVDSGIRPATVLNGLIKSFNSVRCQGRGRCPLNT
jgi:hypothetical protein